MKYLSFPAVLLIALILSVSSAHATLLEGKMVQWDILFPDISTVWATGEAIVAPQGTHVQYGINIADFYDNKVILSFITSGQEAPTPFNGGHLLDVNNTIDDFTSVTINQATNMVGFDASRISFDKNNIWVNLAGLPFDTDTKLVFDLKGGAPVPEPATLFLFGAGLMVAGCMRKKTAL